MSNREWVEKLGTLDTETYPWQLALIEELMQPPPIGDPVLFVDNTHIRRLFPWEEHDTNTGIYKEKSVWMTGTHVVTKASGVDYRMDMLDDDKYLKILRYFFDKGEFSDR